MRFVIYQLRYIVDRRSDPNSVGCNRFWVAGVFISLWRLVRPSQDGGSAERLINALFGAKDGGQHHQERALGLTSLRCNEATLRLSYAKLRQYGTWQDHTICLC